MMLSRLPYATSIDHRHHADVFAVTSPSPGSGESAFIAIDVFDVTFVSTVSRYYNVEVPYYDPEIKEGTEWSYAAPQ